MSKRTNPNGEPSVTCGFYDSYNGDRKYSTSEINCLFDGLITDGVFSSIGDKLIAEATDSLIVNIGSGKCWFNRSWTINDATLPITCTESDILRPRYDAIVVTINTNRAVRDNFIEFVEGEADSDPKKPSMECDPGIYRYPLCYIYRPANSKTITPVNIENMVGTSSTPFVTGLVQQANLDELLGQWRAQLDEFVANEEVSIDSELESFKTENEEAFTKWYEEMKTLMNDAYGELIVWETQQELAFTQWFNGMKDQLSTDAAGNLQLQLDKESITRILLNGFADGTKVINEDGTKITSTDSQGRVLVKMFKNNFKRCLTTLYITVDGEQLILGMLNKTFSDDGTTITSTVTINPGVTNTEEV